MNVIKFIRKRETFAKTEIILQTSASSWSFFLKAESITGFNPTFYGEKMHFYESKMWSDLYNNWLSYLPGYLLYFMPEKSRL